MHANEALQVLAALVVFVLPVTLYVSRVYLDAVGICVTHLHINEALHGLHVLQVFYLHFRLGVIHICTKGAAFAPRAFARAAAFPRFIQLFIAWRKSS